LALVEIKMATRKRAATSESGAYMSQYDVEVEKKLAAIEARLDAIEANLNNAPESSGGDDARLNKLIAKLNTCAAITEYFPKGEDGVRRIDI
jgi:hypothetical protein